MPTPQPVVKSAVLAALTALVPAVLGLLVAFGVDLSDAQQQAILALTAAVTGLVGTGAPIVAAVFARREVTPLASPRDNEGNVLVPARRQAP
jgi:hypothetical protein